MSTTRNSVVAWSLALLVVGCGSPQRKAPSGTTQDTIGSHNGTQAPGNQDPNAPAPSAPSAPSAPGPPADFVASPVEQQIVPANSFVDVEVSVERGEGTPQEIQITFVTGPSGVVASNATIAADASSVVLRISADQEAYYDADDAPIVQFNLSDGTHSHDLAISLQLSPPWGQRDEVWGVQPVTIWARDIQATLDGTVFVMGTAGPISAVARMGKASAAGFVAFGDSQIDDAKLKAPTNIRYEAGRLLVTGRAAAGQSVLAFGDDGALDGDFGAAGYEVIDYGASSQSAARTVKLSNDRFASAGYADGAMTITVHQQNGALDSSFSGDGKLTLDFLASSLNSNTFVVELKSGKLLAVASVLIAEDEAQIGVARINANGTLDTSYSSDGYEFINCIGGVNDKVGGVVLDHTGRPFIVATTADIDATVKTLCIERLDTSGVPDPSFFSRKVGNVFVAKPRSYSAMGVIDIRDVEMMSGDELTIAGVNTVDTVKKPFLSVFDTAGDAFRDFSTAAFRAGTRAVTSISPVARNRMAVLTEYFDEGAGVARQDLQLIYR